MLRVIQLRISLTKLQNSYVYSGFQELMNLYSSKQRWKIGLILMAFIILGVSLFVSNQILKKITEREKDKALHWVMTIQKRAELVRLSNRIFQELRTKEREKIQLVVDAQKTILNPSDLSVNQDIDFALRIIASNKDIPVILLNEDSTVSQFKNLPDSVHRWNEDKIVDLAKSWQSKERAFEITVFGDMKMFFCYGESIELQRLQKANDSLLLAFNADLKTDKSLLPMILVDKLTGEIELNNLRLKHQSQAQLAEKLREFKAQNSPLELNLGGENGRKLLYYSNPPELTLLAWLPYLQIGFIALLVFVGYLLFSTFRKAEQNQVWAGMAKETAHQLGTPLSSLMAWLGHLSSTGADPMVVNEMQKDLDRLEKITERFSKIGSEAKLESHDLVNTIGHNLEYLRARLSSKVSIKLIVENEGPIVVPHNVSLMEWVVENLCKNAVDAMSGEGSLTIRMQQLDREVMIDISDTGKGLTPQQFKTIFQPGYSTKKRGWGLGLTLVKRIVEEYHKGKVFVLQSELDKGTTFRILLPN